MMKKKKLLALTLSSAFFLLMSTSSSYALTSVKTLFSGSGDFNILEDDDVEWLNSDGGEEGILEVGDTLRGVFDIQSLQSPVSLAIGNGTDYTALSGLFEVEVASKELVDAAADLYDFSFQPVSGGAEGLSVGAMINLYADDTPIEDFPNENTDTPRTRAELEAEVTDGELLYEFGFAGDLDEYWVASGVSDEPSTAEDDTNFAGEYNVALSVVTNNFLPVVQHSEFADLTPGGDGLIDFSGGGGFGGTQLIDTSGEVLSDGDFKFRTVPEPTTMLLFGTGLIGLAGFGRKKFSKKG